ncbi:photosystem I assembly protein Ycf4 [Leptolyngbyaceae cyanobacterium CCMR0082]|uniref:Photosystem I assembly protein Ycf4 n=2 Tax=Adonisia turfae TaxID=2950184 RepID=A0A6M0SDV2_9CYAN|nr:photosystem I assembly protein Ycf4 [Adonisia turfae]NEZ59818.1 photosystem I assembly protein Ycf4 [Adonisia turfae CCMR0081]NEZ66141.1 photosystem I assembly protein Ycf4 [Adonisia turfae CCMR0082]
MAVSKATVSDTTNKDSVLRREILGARRWSNYWWAVVTTIGGTGFLLAGISSYMGINLLPFADPTQLIFIPQGVVMCFYGIAALLLSLYLWLICAWNVGGGYNLFDKKSEEVQIFRWGFPGKNRKIDFKYPLASVTAIRVDIREGLSPKRALYLKVKGKGDIPLTRVGQPMSLASVENQGAELARFLQVPLEGL